MKIAVVIPCYRVKEQIVGVLDGIGPEVTAVYVVDDACPEGSGNEVKKCVNDSRVSVIFHESNRGVGAATITGYRAALGDGAEIIIKLDGDGQMNPAMIPQFVRPILNGTADYVKGDRFDNIESLRAMPFTRVVGNAFLSIFAKFSTGYWSITDPTNGFTACHRVALQAINLDKISDGYFFESDILFRLGMARCVVSDLPMDAVYGDEKSNLRISKVLVTFPFLHAKNALKRILYRYYLREWNPGSFELPLSILLLSMGSVFGASLTEQWLTTGVAVSAGQVTGTAILLILGLQLSLSFLNFDIQAEPRVPRTSLGDH